MGLESRQAEGDEPSLCLPGSLVTTWYTHATYGQEFKKFADEFWETHGTNEPDAGGLDTYQI